MTLRRVDLIDPTTAAVSLDRIGGAASPVVEVDDVTTDLYSSGALVGKAIQFKKVTLTAAQLKTLFTAPPVIIPAQGANTVIVVLNAIGIFHHGNQNFSSSGAGAVLAYAAATSPISRPFGPDGTSAVDQLSFGIPTDTDLNTLGLGGVVNQPVVLAAGGDNGPNGNGTMDVYVYYLVQSIA